jgi:hypothetical protein
VCIRCGKSLQVFQASAPALQLPPFRCRLPALLFVASGVILRQSRHVGSQTLCLLQSFHSRRTSVLLCGEHFVVKSRRSLHDCRGIHCDQALSAPLFTGIASNTTDSPLLKAGIGGTSSLAASSLARVDRCDSEKLRNFNMLKRLVRAFSGWTGGEDGRSDGTVAMERREVGGAYSLFGRGDEGGRARDVVLVRAALSVPVGWWESSGLGLKTLRRRRSRGMAGTRYYMYEDSRVGTLMRWCFWCWS